LIYIDINPVITIGSFSIRWYGVFVALAVLTVVLWTIRTVGKDNKLSYDTAFTAALIGIPSGIIVSRIIHVIDRWQYFIHHPGELIGGEGLTIWGAVLGAALGVWIYSRIGKFQFGRFTDLIAPGIILSQVVGRIGCIINGCCFGTETDIFCAIIYSHPESYAPLGIPVHPTQLYEIVYNLIVFGILLLLRGRFKPEGSLFLTYLSFYSVWRLAVGFMREGSPFLFGLHQAQIIGIIILLIAIPIFVFRVRWVKKENVTEETEEV